MIICVALPTDLAAAAATWGIDRAPRHTLRGRQPAHTRQSLSLVYRAGSLAAPEAQPLSANRSAWPTAAVCAHRAFNMQQLLRRPDAASSAGMRAPQHACPRSRQVHSQPRAAQPGRSAAEVSSARRRVVVRGRWLHYRRLARCVTRPALICGASPCCCRRPPAQRSHSNR